MNIKKRIQQYNMVAKARGYWLRGMVEGTATKIKRSRKILKA
jgi:hypothetical protein